MQHEAVVLSLLTVMSHQVDASSEVTLQCWLYASPAVQEIGPDTERLDQSRLLRSVAVAHPTLSEWRMWKNHLELVKASMAQPECQGLRSLSPRPQHGHNA